MPIGWLGYTDGMSDARQSRRRWFHPTPSWLIVGLMAVECLLWLSERLQWFSFNQHKGWTVLIGVAAVGATILLMLLWFAAALLFRVRFQFSIRSLMVLTVAVAIPCGWLAVEMKAAREHGQIEDKIDKLGGSVNWSWEAGYDANGNLLPYAIPPAPEWLRNLLGDHFFTEILEVYLDGTQSTDADLEPFKGLTQLRHLFLRRTLVTDAGLENLKRLNQLQELYLAATKVTDEGVQKLQRALPNCKIYHGHD